MTGGQPRGAREVQYRGKRPATAIRAKRKREADLHRPKPKRAREPNKIKSKGAKRLLYPCFFIAVSATRATRAEWGVALHRRSGRAPVYAPQCETG